MPGATCGLWGVCGSVTSIGVALALIDQTDPLTTDSSWGNHMRFTSKALEKMSEIKCGFSKRNEQCLKNRCPYYVEVNND